jgi:Sulfotransferase family
MTSLGSHSNQEIPLRTEASARAPVPARSQAPVFVVGCPRSGTTLLYHVLLSAGGFAIYRSETHVFNLLEPAYGDLSRLGNRKKLMKAWFGSKLFRLSGLNPREVEEEVLAECKNGGDLLRIIMGDIARKQNVNRWADSTPEHLLYIRRIKQTIPNALLIHIIRDGRDVALSLEKQRWIRPLPGDTDRHLEVAALYWEWIVNRGRKLGRELGSDYCEIHFEKLVDEPRPVLRELSQFIEQDLDYDRIRKVAIGSVAEPNTSFENGFQTHAFQPVGRWRNALAGERLTNLEILIGSTLRELGYAVGTAGVGGVRESELRRLRWKYQCYFELKLWLKSRTPLGKYFVSTDLSWL